MRVLIQRVSRAQVTVENQVLGKINRGLLLFYGVHKEDSLDPIPWLVDKILSLRIFEDEEGKMNHSVQDVGGKLLVVSQFTLYGDCEKGRRPSFTCAMMPHTARGYYEDFVELLREKMGCAESVQTGEFGAQMEVDLINDGPVTFLLSR